jgi:hypothetical protein
MNPIDDFRERIADWWARLIEATRRAFPVNQPTPRSRSSPAHCSSDGQE